MSNNSAGGGIGCLTLLTLIFITLKLTGHIDWTWLQVLVPSIFGAGVVVLVFLIAFLIIIFKR